MEGWPLVCFYTKQGHSRGWQRGSVMSQSHQRPWLISAPPNTSKSVAYGHQDININLSFIASYLST